MRKREDKEEAGKKYPGNEGRMYKSPEQKQQKEQQLLERPIFQPLHQLQQLT